MENSSKEQIKEYIVKSFMQGKGILKDDDSLFEKNIVDSFGILELVSFIEKKFKISINPSEVTIENFDTINKIVRLIEDKKK